MKSQVCLQHSRQDRGEAMAFAGLAVAGAVTIMWAVSMVMDSAVHYEQIEAALSKTPTLHAVTNTTARGVPPRATGRSAETTLTGRSGVRIRNAGTAHPVF